MKKKKRLGELKASFESGWSWGELHDYIKQATYQECIDALRSNDAFKDKKTLRSRLIKARYMNDAADFLHDQFIK